MLTVAENTALAVPPARRTRSPSENFFGGLSLTGYFRGCIMSARRTADFFLFACPVGENDVHPRKCSVKDCGATTEKNFRRSPNPRPAVPPPAPEVAVCVRPCGAFTAYHE